MGIGSTVRVVAACLVPIALLEAGMQFFGGVGPLGPMHRTEINETLGLQYPSRCHRGQFGAIYTGRPDVEATMCTDAYGTIEPTSLTALRANPGPAGAPFLLACGGSTTEITAIEPDERWVTRLSKDLRVAAINAGAAAKGMTKCAITIDYLLERVPAGHQPLILITNSVNTLGTFLPARFGGWTGGPIPDQPHAPPPLHPQVRAWIPGLYHLAALTVSAIGSKPDRSYADALADGCCHMAGTANREPAHRFDWTSEQNRELYARFTAGSVDAIDAVLKRRGIPRDRVLFVVEPNAFVYDAMPHLQRDFRQHLHGLDGKRLDSKESASITNAYDEIYARVVGERFTVIRADRFPFEASAFYDAVHMSAAGARAMADNLAPILKERLAAKP